MRRNAPLTGVDEKDAAVIQFGREMLGERQMSSATFAKAKQLFGAEHANVQPHSGSQANQAVYAAVLQPGDWKATWRLIAPWLKLSSSAARVKLPWRAEASKA